MLYVAIFISDLVLVVPNICQTTRKLHVSYFCQVLDAESQFAHDVSSQQRLITSLANDIKHEVVVNDELFSSFQLLELS